MLAPSHSPLTHAASLVSRSNSQGREVEGIGRQQGARPRQHDLWDMNDFIQPPSREFIDSQLSQEGIVPETWDATAYTDGVANCMALSDTNRSELHVFKQVSSFPMP